MLPAGNVVTVPTAIVALDPAGPVGPVSPVSPFAPCGIPKSKTADDELPEFVTVALLPAGNVVTVPTAIDALGPAGPIGPVSPFCPRGPVGPVSPVSPFGPCGIPKSKTASIDVPEFTTVALLSDGSVVTVPIEIFAD